MPKLTPEQLAKLDAVRENIPATRPGELLPHVRFIGDIKHLMVDPDYAYAESTLRGILLIVEQTQYVTANQRRAIENITAAPNKGGERYSRKGIRRRRDEE